MNNAKVGVVFALASEERGLEKVLDESWLLAHRVGGGSAWRVGNADMTTVICGVGRERCAKATQTLIEAGAQWIVSAGFAAGLHPEAQVGDVYVPERIALLKNGANEPIESSKSLITAIPPSSAFRFPVRSGLLVTSDTVVCAAAEKRRIFHDTAADALDMESYAAGEVCRQYGVPFAAIRSITDIADHDLPNAIPMLMNMDSRIRQIAFATCRPKLWAHLSRLHRQANTAAENLGDVIGLMLLRLL